MYLYVYTIEMVFTDISAVFSMELAIFFRQGPRRSCEEQQYVYFLMRQPTVTMLYHRYTPYWVKYVYIYICPHATRA